jgi:hypothetical protein
MYWVRLSREMKTLFSIEYSRKNSEKNSPEQSECEKKNSRLKKNVFKMETKRYEKSL